MRPITIVEVAAYRAAHPPCPLWKPLGEFLDEFYDVGAHDLVEMLIDEPTSTIPEWEAAFLAGAVEYLSKGYGLPCPAWVMKPKYFLDSPVWPDAYGAAFRDYCEKHSPLAFRKRMVFIDDLPLRRKQGPVFKTDSAAG